MKKQRKGQVGILNVGAGDTKLVFDPSKPDEVKRSARIVKDMIRRGFVLLIEIDRDDKGPIYRRALDFDESAAEYIIAGTASDSPNFTEPDDDQESTGAAPRKGNRRKKDGGGRRTGTPKLRVPATSTNAVSVAATAGG